MAADADLFSVITKLTLAVVGGGDLGVGGPRGGTALHSVTQPSPRARGGLLGDLEKEDKSALTVDPLCPKDV